MADSGDNPEELKAGHPKAVKVGGMRVVQHKHSDKDATPEPPKPTKEDKQEFGEDKPVKATHSSVVISGAEVSEPKAFPTEAVKSFHEKPKPKHDTTTNPPPSNKPKMIQQPRK